MLFASNTLDPYYKSIQPTATKKEQLVKTCLDIIARKDEKEMADSFHEMRLLWSEVVSEAEGAEITTLLVGLAKIVELYPGKEIDSNYLVSELIASTFSTILYILGISVKYFS
jgi:hypothetical protein